MGSRVAHWKPQQQYGKQQGAITVQQYKQQARELIIINSSRVCAYINLGASTAAARSRVNRE
jgi:hypothetical protein